MAKIKKNTVNTNHEQAVGTASARFDSDSNESNSALRGHAGVIVYDKMRRQDPTVKSILSVITSPLKGAQWTIRSQANDDDETSKEIAELFYSYFWEGATCRFNEFLSNALTMLPFGFAVFEKVWTAKEVGGRVLQVLDLQFRPQVTITEINARERFIKQETSTGTYQISFDNLLFLVLDKEGDDYWGNSILRPCYHAYQMKKEQYGYWSVAGGRQASGFLHFGVPRNMNKNSREYKDLEESGKKISDNRAQTLITPKEINVQFMHENISADFYQITINTLDTNIRNAALANFIGLGTSNTGSYSVGEVQYKLFMQAEAAISNQIEQVFTAAVLHPMTDVNFGVREYYPELVCQDLDKDAVVQKLTLALQFMGMGIVKSTPKDEADIRYKLGLGEVLDDDGEDTPVDSPAIPPALDSNGSLNAAKKDSWASTALVYQQELYRAMLGNLSLMADKAVADTRKHLKHKGLPGLADALTISTTLYQNVLIKKLSFLARRGWQVGMDCAAKSGIMAAKGKGDAALEDEELSAVPAPLRGYVKNKAKGLVDKHASGLKNVILNVSNKPNSGFNLDTVIAEIGKQVDAYLSKSQLLTDAGSAAIQTLEDAEQSFYQEEVSDEIAYFTYQIGSAREHTELCLWLDGKTYTPYGKEFYMVYPQNHHGCTGRMVPTFKRPGLPAPDPVNHDKIPPPSLMEMKQF